MNSPGNRARLANGHVGILLCAVASWLRRGFASRLPELLPGISRAQPLAMISAFSAESVLLDIARVGGDRFGTRNQPQNRRRVTTPIGPIYTCGLYHPGAAAGRLSAYSAGFPAASDGRRWNFFILYRSVSRVIESSSAARVWFHPVVCKAFKTIDFSASSRDIPGMPDKCERTFSDSCAGGAGPIPKLAGPIHEASSRTMARSMAFLSSRILPGQSCAAR